jgi:Uma2 family endonuclease
MLTKVPVKEYPTPQEYLSAERIASGKNEYYEGQILEMPGASEGHNFIVSNLIREIGPFLKGKPFDIFPSDFRVGTPNMDTYVYPDVTIVSGKCILQDDQFDTLLNPSVVIEVMSTYSKERDLGYKFFRYQRIPSVKEYIVIDSRSYFVQIARRQEDDSWKFEQIEDNKSASLFIETIQYSVPLKDIYYHVFFD